MIRSGLGAFVDVAAGAADGTADHGHLVGNAADDLCLRGDADEMRPKPAVTSAVRSPRCSLELAQSGRGHEAKPLSAR